MALKAAQTSPKYPVHFDDDLKYRCFPHKFRKIGDPYGYLDGVGLDAILEYIIKGNLLIDVAEATDVPLIVLRRWVEDRGYFSQIEDAENESAEGYLARAATAVRTAPTEFELRRAKEMMKHAQFMAEKKNKKTYGAGVNKDPGKTVHYEFHIGNNADPQQAAAVAQAVIEAESTRVDLQGPSAEDTASDRPHLSFTLGDVFAPGGLPDTMPFGAPVPPLGAVPASPALPAPPEPVLVAARPLVPSPEKPDVGPFYDDPADQANTSLPDHYEAADA